jgi:hypothetical protein
MHAGTLVEPDLVTDRKLRMFSLYVDFAAAARARWAISQISQLAGEHWKPSTEMWNLDSLAANGFLRKMITRDAADADVLIIAVSSLDRRETELVQWLDSVAAFKTNRPVSGLLIGLLGDEDQRPGELDWTVKQFLRCAQRLDQDFIWRWMEQGAMNDRDWLIDSVEALLTRKQSARAEAFFSEAVLGTV